MALMALSSRLLARGRPGMTLALSRRAPLSSSGAPLAAKAESMKQVDVDSAAVQENLGKMQMEFIKKAEADSRKSAQLHRRFRRRDVVVAGVCFSLVGLLYGYTMYAIQQEVFLDDFDMPEETEVRRYRPQDRSSGALDQIRRSKGFESK